MKYITLIILTLFLVSCNGKIETTEKNNESKNEETVNNEIKIIDSLNNEVNVNNDSSKVITVGSSITEVWLAVGGEVHGTTIDAIEDERFLLNEDIVNVGTMKEPNLEAILYEEPSLVILSANLSSHKQLGEVLSKANIPVYYVSIDSFEDYEFVMSEFVKISGEDEIYYENVEKVKLKIDEVLSKTDKDNDIEILLLRTSTAKLMALKSSHFAGDILKDMGTINIADESDSGLDTLNIEAILEKDPDYIFVVAMGNNYDESMKKFLDYQKQNPLWNDLTAVKEGKVIDLPKELFHNKPNQRWSESYEYIYKIIYES